MKINLLRRWLRVGFSLIILIMLSSPVIGVIADGANPPVFLPIIGGNFNFGPGTISGLVIDASPGRNPIPDARICIYPTNCTTTGSDGIFQFTEVEAGGHLLSVTADTFNSDSRWIGVMAGKTTTQNFALSPNFTSENVVLRIVLTWDPTPSWSPLGTDNDLDAHMWMTAAFTPWHISATSEGDCTNYPNACLEVDYTQGFGPETVAIRKLENATYYYGVLNYYQGYPGVPPMVGTSAQVQVYNENGLLYTFKVPSTGDGEFWYVFSMASDGNLAVFTERNCITSFSEDSPPSCP
jgi:adhesin/invasin